MASSLSRLNIVCLFLLNFADSHISSAGIIDPATRSRPTVPLVSGDRQQPGEPPENTIARKLAVLAVGNLTIKARAIVLPIPGCIMASSRRMTR